MQSKALVHGAIIHTQTACTETFGAGTTSHMSLSETVSPRQGRKHDSLQYVGFKGIPQQPDGHLALQEVG